MLSKGAIALLAAAQANADSTLIHNARAVPQGWAPSDDIVDGTQDVEVLVGLKRSNVDKLEQIFTETSTPGAKGFLEHLDWQEMGNLVRPSEEAIGSVVGMLASHGGHSIRIANHGDYVSATMPIAEIEKLTQAKFQMFKQERSGNRLARIAGEVKLPQQAGQYVETFTGVQGFPLSGAGPSTSANGGVIPAVINKAYGIPKVKKSGASNIQSIGQFQGQYVSPSDLKNFCKKYDSGADCSIDKFIGQNQGSQPGIESMLDTEYIEGVGQDHKTWVYSYPNFDFCSDLLKWASDVSGESTHPNVVSLSYGSQKIDFCDSQVRTRLSQDVQKLGAMGITVVIASGDDGSGGNTRQGSNNGKLSPSFPASIPHALAVGSTFFKSGLSGEEQATTQFGSGGGFSYDYTAPSYQTSAVKAYLSKSPQVGSKKFAKGGRASPDVSALGEQFEVVSGGQTVAVGGTSASTPTWGAIITLLNEECLSASNGKKTLGFVNPLFYQNPQAFNDVTEGSNAIADNQGQGWKATKGWDAVTGLGSPNFPKLAAVVKKACGGATVVV